MPLRTTRRLLLCALLAFAGAGTSFAAPIRFEKFDKSHSTVGFRVPILGGMSEVEGKFTDFAIVVEYDPDAPERSSVEASIEVASIDTGIAARDEDLRGDGFFDAGKFPQIRFRSTTITPRGERWVAAGPLEMKGVSRPIEVEFEIKGLREMADPAGWILGVRATATLDRDDYGIDWRHPDPLFVGDEVTAEIRLVSRLHPKSIADPAAP